MNEMSHAQKQFLKKRKRNCYAVHTIRILLLLLFLSQWELCTAKHYIDSFIFSSPSKILRCFISMVRDRSIFVHIGITLYETIFSFILVTVFSLTITILLWFSKKLSLVLEPFLVMLNSLPKSALAPLFLVWFGAGTRTIIIAGMSVAIFGSILSLYTTFITTDQEKIKLIYTLQGNHWNALSKVVLPSSIPAIISNMKVNIGLCLVGVIIGEFLAAKQGLGYLIIYSSQIFKMDWMLMSLLLLCIFSMLLYSMINVVEKWIQKRY